MSTEERGAPTRHAPAVAIPLGMSMGTLIGVFVGAAIDDLTIAITVGTALGVALGGVAYTVLIAIGGRDDRR